MNVRTPQILATVPPFTGVLQILVCAHQELHQLSDLTATGCDFFIPYIHQLGLSGLTLKPDIIESLLYLLVANIM